MGKRKADPIEEAPVRPEEIIEDTEYEYDETASAWQRAPLWLRVSSTVIVVGILLVTSFELVYAGKIFPGVSVNGVTLAGSSKAAAAEELEDHIKKYNGQVITITHGDTNLRIPVASLGVQYDVDKAIELAYAYGRQGSWTHQVRQQLRALLGRPTTLAVYSYNDERLVPYVVDLGDDEITPVTDASLSFDSEKPQVTPAEAGTRLDYGRLTQLVSERLATTSTDPVIAPVYELAPQLTTEALKAVTDQLGDYVAGPINLSYASTDITIDQKTIISWIQVGARTPRTFMFSHDVADLYPPPASATIGLSQAAVDKYVAELANDIDQTAQNAGIAMQDGKLAIVQPSLTGLKLDQAGTTKAILAKLKAPAGDRDIDMQVAVTQADVNETNLESLGIKEQLSQGETYFPGSPSTRLTNVRAGAKRFNGVLLKPGETFSFGALLGEVGPQTGYVPELVILNNHEEKQYGGGLCQVSSTAFRAALQAGLPITERHNHSFAISYYTWPYAAPGVDATIYYPAVDFKFVNDTGHYILMQTTMTGVDLKFDFYGTKTKTGVIRGPEFITGTSDHTKPSKTVFYRDVLDLNGKVAKTDTFYTTYKSSLDFPITKEFN